ncbi:MULTISPECIES: cysteine hydrolase family protein [Pediococcus]|uniref:Amidase n=1 Tax=Pediococcus pentosaceus (strain ATCC 25745 / CCUG 21536 / LMG 10740 / 183-1w) TaxID=278197 RepID=Q03E73_PEDPA|nr:MULTISPECIES: cysteine hydrolase family protein [Pediococcus]ABJ68499.1 Amidase [Pediococcus pentosaceus ATCC 25745]KAF5439521.1 cysteine hydrolase [Pediococcus sp. EKM202D]KAF5439816.1 cysteine hydrolase [Pediococcus sp. EKM201D]QHM65706.1 Isochorismatase family protein YecD [Pediococcus pentosaceus]QHM67425.1 Isochorismatase family protein YecD [Pediococcus pentosaceus]
MITSDALLVIDLQNGVCRGRTDIDHLEKLILQVNQLIQCYRKKEKEIIFIQHNEVGLVCGSTNWKILPEINNKITDIYVDKTHANSFYLTNLEKILKSKNIHSIEICGAQTQYCIDSTVKMAHGLGYNLQMQKNGTTTYDNEFMTAKDTIDFYEDIWKDRFLKLY